jgi:hypothetical protein
LAVAGPVNCLSSISIKTAGCSGLLKAQCDESVELALSRLYRPLRPGASYAARASYQP